MSREVLKVVSELYPLVRDGTIKKAQGQASDAEVVVYKVGQVIRIDIKRKEDKSGS